MKKLLIIALTITILFSCAKKENSNKPGNNYKDRSKPLAWGHRQTIYAFADKPVWKYAEKTTRQTLERTYYTTVNEKMFTIERADYPKIDDFFKFNNLLFYCNWESNDPVSSYVREVLGSQVNDDLQKNGAAVYPVYNLWADDQLVLFIVGENEENLLKMNILQANEIWEIFKNRLYKRIEYVTFRDRIKPKNNFADKIWEIDLPLRYVLFMDAKDENFTSYLGRSASKPDRFIAVYYEQADSTMLSKDWLIDKRNELAKKYYEGDSFTRNDIMIQKYKIAGYDGWMIRGRWQNDIHAVGGAFSAFAFYHNETQNLFLIDNSVYYPEGDKLPALIELEIISNSLKIK